MNVVPFVEVVGNSAFSRSLFSLRFGLFDPKLFLVLFFLRMALLTALAGKMFTLKCLMIHAR